MKPGSIVYDLAAEQGVNSALEEAKIKITNNGKVMTKVQQMMINF